MPYPRKIKNVDYDTMYRLYITEKKSSGEIAKMYGITDQPVLDRLRDLGIPKRSAAEHNALRSHKDVNEEFFSEWSPEMAYVLGWVLSDGNVDYGTGNLRICIADEEVLHKISAVMELTNGIKPVKYRRGKQQYALAICRQKITEDLVKLGVKQGNRTYDQPRVDVPTEFQRHFIRGFFDGDGSIITRNRKVRDRTHRVQEIVLCKASEDFIDCLREMIVDALDIHVSKCSVLNPDTGNTTYRLSIGSRIAVRKMYHWMYEGVENRLWMERKYEKFVREFGPLGKESDAI